MRLKKKLCIRKVNVCWERVSKASAKANFPVCHKHSSLVESFTACGLCKRRLTIGGISTLGLSGGKHELHRLNELLSRDGIPSQLASELVYVCKLCKSFCGIKLRVAAQPDYFKNHRQDKTFFKDYRKRYDEGHNAL